METKIAFSKQNYNWAKQGIRLLLTASLVNVTFFTVHAETSNSDDLSLGEQQRAVRLASAHELLGSDYQKSIVKNGEDVRRINDLVYKWTFQNLPQRFKSQYKRIAQQVIDQSLTRKFDPVLIMSMIKTESKFNPLAKGSHGEIGLMQLKPSTAKWICGLDHIQWHGARTLENPLMNIQIGVAYLSWLREHANSQAQLYISAYNIGRTQVIRETANHVWPKQYVLRVMHHYVDFYRDLSSQEKQRRVADLD